MTTRELAIIGLFPNPNGKGEVRKKYSHMQDGSWMPDSEDYREVVLQSKIFRKALSASKVKENQAVFTCNNLNSLLSIIVDAEAKTERQDKTIKRIDLVTHGNADFLSLSGQILPRNVAFDDDEPAADLNFGYHIITERALNTLDGMEEDGKEKKSPKVTFSNLAKTKEWEIAKIRMKFSEGARFVIYGCDVGQNEKLLQHMANTFGVIVGAFKVEIGYRYVGKHFLLRLENPREKIPNGQEVQDYRQLDNNKQFYHEFNPR